ncbi:hypothetical protein DF033_32075 [Burkholderia cenocepacia]|nr:hypothetical protein DF033_32075 [Burkholderia cenocepacia]
MCLIKINQTNPLAHSIVNLSAPVNVRIIDPEVAQLLREFLGNSINLCVIKEICQFLYILNLPDSKHRRQRLPRNLFHLDTDRLTHQIIPFK